MSKLIDSASSAPASNAGIKSPGNAGDIPSVNKSIRHRVVLNQQIGWGDCDPAQIAYTANIPGWGLSGIEEWYRQCIGYDWYAINLELGIGTPFVSLNFSFLSPVKPGDILQIHVRVSGIGNRSISHSIEGFQNDRKCFTGETVAAFVDAATMKPTPVPENIRQSVNHYMSIQENELAS